MKPEEFLHYQLKTMETVLKEDIQYHGKNYWKEVYFIPNALTPIGVNDVDLSIDFMGKHLKYPICVGSLAGGYKNFIPINEKIAEFTAKYKIAQGVGDQRCILQKNADEDALKSFQVVREKNPDGLVFANISGTVILESKDYVKDVQTIVDSINADGVEIWVSPLLDILVDPRNTGYKGLIERIHNLTYQLHIPVFIKSFTTGLSNEDIRPLWDAGVAGINIQGVGGTSIARIETVKDLSTSQKQTYPPIKRPFDFWGIPTVWSLLDISLRPENRDIPLIVGGGIRNGREAVKALALGADLVSFAYPVLIEIMEDFGYPDEENLKNWFLKIITQMKITMSLLGVRNIKELRQIVRNRTILIGRTHEWVRGRNLKYPPAHYKDVCSP
ncbi:alpha-hydroxy-acid oxidizing protein [Candidatus Harpocratesius sp.]